MFGRKKEDYFQLRLENCTYKVKIEDNQPILYIEDDDRIYKVLLHGEISTRPTTNVKKMFWYVFLELDSEPKKLNKNIITKAYKNLAKVYHPDVNKGDDKLMRLLNQAKEEGLLYIKNELHSCKTTTA